MQLLPINYLFDSHGLGQVARLIHIAAAPHRDVIRQQLQRNHFDQRRQQFGRVRAR